ncbi:acyltransferase family protein [Sphingomonas sp. URHD0057]|uniref:acyltransferase family protein n=1 Tax=Sphingomonas sp. URHD0057 TaxID=1380389 RepID=UPI0018CC27BF|nr:acyltransferase [Sphingomonas sp. URHD0057]
MSTGHRFVMLDGLRGVAALIVAFGHISEVLGFGVLPHAHLAVDFFFVLSGFVIAQVYEARLQTTMTPGEFFIRRAIRLQPMVILGAVLTATIVIIEGWSGTGTGAGAILWALVAASLFIPFHTLSAPAAFPLNGPVWSLFAEYWVNILYSFIAPALTRVRLQALLVAGLGILLVLLSMSGGIGRVWESDTIGLSAGRVLYPFFAGVLVSRAFRDGRLTSLRLSPVMAVTILCAVLLAPPTRFDAAFDFASITMGMPLLVAASTNDNLYGIARRTMLLSGVLSYPIYVLHFPLAFLLIVPFLFTVVASGLAGPALALFMVTLVATSYLVLRYIDEPLRAWLTARSKAHAIGANTAHSRGG